MGKIRKARRPQSVDRVSVSAQFPYPHVSQTGVALCVDECTGYVPWQTCGNAVAPASVRKTIVCSRLPPTPPPRRSGHTSTLTPCQRCVRYMWAPACGRRSQPPVAAGHSYKAWFGSPMVSNRLLVLLGGHRSRPHQAFRAPDIGTYVAPDDGVVCSGKALSSDSRYRLMGRFARRQGTDWRRHGVALFGAMPLPTGTRCVVEAVEEVVVDVDVDVLGDRVELWFRRRETSSSRGRAGGGPKSQRRGGASETSSPTLLSGAEASRPTRRRGPRGFVRSSSDAPILLGAPGTTDLRDRSR